MSKIKNNIFKKYLKTFLLSVLFVSFSVFLKSQNAIEHYYKSLAYTEYDELLLAENEMKKAISLDENNHVYKLYLGKLFFADKQYQKALVQFYSVEKIKSNYASLELAKVYSILNNIDSSIYFLQKYLGFYKKISKSEIKNDLAFGNIIYTEKWENLWTKNYYSVPQQMLLEAEYSHKYSNKLDALSKTNLIIKKYKNFAPAYTLKAEILVEGKNYDKALKAMNKTVSLNPQKAEYYLQRARIYVHLKKYDKAILDFQKYQMLNPYDIKVYN
ncbi:MAG: tetratricopeptide repeat protein, partial [Bacteroidota bacterium]|nr:tetratricopeptide repeat protein [Bacteroidota bacterium]